VNRYLDLQLNLSNLNNEYYYDRLGGGHLVPGPSRYALVSTNFHF
jgi:outer membrane receptor for monomeric catechols